MFAEASFKARLVTEPVVKLLFVVALAVLLLVAALADDEVELVLVVC